MKFPGLFALGIFLLSLGACSSKKSNDPVKASPPTPAAKGIAKAAALSEPAPLPAPAAKVPVTDSYHGQDIVDDYRWLEDWQDPAVQSWSKALDLYTRSKLAALPNVKEIGARVQAVLSRASVSYYDLAESGGHLFALKHQPPLKQSLLVQLSSASELSSEVVVLDPNKLDPSGSTTIDFFRASPDGSMVALSLSKGGSESGDVYVYLVATGEQVGQVVPRVNGGTAGGDLAWQPDGKGFFYTRYPRGDERPAEDADFYTQTFYHALNTPSESDRYELGKDFPRIAEIELTMDPRTGRLLATVQEGDGGKFAHYIRTPNKAGQGSWKQISSFGDGNVQVAFGPGTDLFVVSTKDAPHGKLLRMAAQGSVDKARLVIAEGEDTIVSSFWGSRSVVYTGERLYLTYQLGGPSELRVFDDKGTKLAAPEQLANGAAGSIVPLADGSVLFANGSWTSPSAWFRFDAKLGVTEKTAMVEEAPIDLSGVKVERKFATSKDGTKVPVNIMIPEGATMDASSPALVTGYGGYGVNLTPRYRSSHALMLEQGIIVAVVNLRGGGEYGEAWHLGGNLTNKQNVFDDFAAALEMLVADSYTSKDRLIIEGGSNGGLLMGALLVQHPDLVKAVVSHVGIYDMLRVELSSNGAFNITEFGTVTDAKQFEALYNYSPYHHVADGTSYPPVFLLTGANDPRVDPMQSRKFAARLQAATKGGTVLLRTSFDTGHGGGTPLTERIAQTTDVMAFVLDQLSRPFVAK